MTVEVGAVYKNTSGTMILLVISHSSVSAQCVTIWVNEEFTTAYSLGDVDSWGIKLIEENWTRLN